MSCTPRLSAVQVQQHTSRSVRKHLHKETLAVLQLSPETFPLSQQANTTLTDVARSQLPEPNADHHTFPPANRSFSESFWDQDTIKLSLMSRWITAGFVCLHASVTLNSRFEAFSTCYPSRQLWTAIGCIFQFCKIARLLQLVCLLDSCSRDSF